MNRRILVIEPDPTMRRMIERALSSAGFAPTGVATIEASRATLDATEMEAVVVELRATNAEGADGVRALRADFPELPLIVTGTLMTPRVMQELVRARVDDVIQKPFTPRELTTAVERVLRDASSRGEGGLEYAAAMSAARRAIVEGRPHDAAGPLERARSVAPLDAETMALLALTRELEGRDGDADRAYRAALALSAERVTDDALPSEGLARLRAYAGAHVVPSFDHRGRHALWFVGDPTVECALGPPIGTRADVTVFTLGLVPGVGATYARLASDDRAFLIATGALSERLALRIARAFDAPVILAHSDTRARLGSVGEGGRVDVESHET